MSWKLVAERWLNFSGLDQELKEQLDRVKHDGTKLEELFGKNLEFGTAGMRGEIGPGTNRMNIYTVRKASEGLARYLLSEDEKNAQRGVVIAYDIHVISPQNLPWRSRKLSVNMELNPICYRHFPAYSHRTCHGRVYRQRKFFCQRCFPDRRNVLGANHRRRRTA